MVDVDEDMDAEVIEDSLHDHVEVEMDIIPTELKVGNKKKLGLFSQTKILIRLLPTFNSVGMNFHMALNPFCDHILFIILAKANFHTLLADGAYNPSVRPGALVH